MSIIVVLLPLFIFVISCCTISGFMIFGFSSCSVVGMRAFVLLPMSLCTGDPNLSFSGVFRYSSRAKYMSFLSRMAFLIKLLAVCTAFSAMPFDCG